MIKESNVFPFSDLDWRTIRQDLTRDITGISVVPEGKKGVKITLTSVKPGGEFLPHKDDFDHIFYFLRGYGELRITDSIFFIKSKTVAEIPAGTLHGYKNTSDEDMVLITLNIPAD